MRVTEQSIDRLIPYARNPRDNAQAVDKVAASISEFGWKQPIVVDSKMVVVAGHTRLLAAQKLGMKKAPVLIADDLTPNQIKAYRLADNRIAQDSQWDEELLKLELGDLDGEDFNLYLTGFDDEELDALLNYAGASEGEDDVPPIEDVAVSVTGDIWVLGKHRLLCGDCNSDIDKLIHGPDVALVCTSPPYNQNIHKFKPSGMHKGGGWVEKVEKLAYFDGMPEDDYQKWQIDLLGKLFSITHSSGSLFYNHKNRYREKSVISPMDWVKQTDWILRQEIVWSRPGSITQNAKMFIPSDERILWLTKGKSFSFNDSTEIKSYSSVWRMGLETNKDHAVGYPVELPIRAIKAVTNKGDLVFDPFMGSGTTIIAGEKESRPVYGIEINPLYVDVAVRRWQEYTGKEAKLETGETFAEIENARRTSN